MSQSLVIGNGNIVASFDQNLQMRDFHYPFVGEENHTEFGTPHRVGVWTEKKFSWLNDRSWKFDIQYHKGTLVGNSTAQNKNLKIQLRFEDFVYTTQNILFRKITVKNKTKRPREIRIFLGHDFDLYGDKIPDTAEYKSDINAILYHRKDRALLVNGRWQQSKKGMDQYTIGQSADYKTWKDAEDGKLKKNKKENGVVDSVIGFSQHFQPGEEKVLFVWVIAGKNYPEVLKNNDQILELGGSRILDHTLFYWRQWSNKEKFHLSGVSDKIKDLFCQSLVLIRSQIDNRGGIIMSSDPDILKHHQGNYNYIKPRDGAFVSRALSRTGSSEVVRNFFFFCEHIVMKENQAKNPLQQNELGLILVALRDFYTHTQYTKTIEKLFNSVVLKAGQLLKKSINPKTGLPQQQNSDVWGDEKEGIFSSSVACVYGGLIAVSELSGKTGHSEYQQEFQKLADQVKEAMITHLYSFKDYRFYKKIYGKNETDNTVDATLSLIWEMGVLPAGDPRIISTMKAIEKHLWIKTPIQGLARYEGDRYHRNREQKYTDDITGNPWIVTTLWLANWKIEMAQNHKDLKPALDLIDWAVQQKNSAGILPQQVDPFTGVPLSLGPFTWSHSAFIDTVLRFSEKYAFLR